MLKELYNTADAGGETVAEFAPSFIRSAGTFAKAGAMRGVGDLARGGTILGGAAVVIVGVSAVAATAHGAIKGTKRLFRRMRDDRPTASDWSQFRKESGAQTNRAADAT